MSGSETKVGANPYVGPRPFMVGERIFGRDDEIRDLFYLLNAERIVVLHSPSGAGKTSLVQAGLVPRLKREGFDVCGIIRVNIQPVDPALSTEFQPLATKASDTAIGNRFVASTIASLEEDLPERLRRPSSEIRRLRLADYLKNRPRRRAAPNNVVLIFDQFEELLTVDAHNVAEKHGFFDQLSEVLRNRNIWSLFCLREDYLAPFDPYGKQIPTQFKNRFRIDLLDLDAARVAITLPAASAGRTFTRAASDLLIERLATLSVQQPDGSFAPQTGQYVEPVLLQVVCQQLWDKLDPENRGVGPNDIDELGDVHEALVEYYANSVACIAEGDNTRERRIREWISNKLLTPAGIRDQVLQGKGASDGLENDAVFALINAHLIRAEHRRNATWLELAHDRLIEPVKSDNERWFKANLNVLQRRASLWLQSDRSNGMLLRGEELRDAREWAKSNPTIVTPIERDLFERSQREETKEDAILSLALIAAIVAVVAVFFYVQAGRLKTEAEESLRKALLNEAAALRQSTASDRRPKALNAVRKAADIRFGLDTRNEYFRCLDVPDIQRIASDATLKSISTDSGFSGFGRVDSQTNQLVIAPESGPFLMIDMTTGRRTKLIQPEVKVAQPAAIHGKHRRLACADRDDLLVILDLDTGKVISRPVDQNDNQLQPHCLAFDTNSDILVVVARASVANKFDLYTYSLDDQRTSLIVSGLAADAFYDIAIDSKLSLVVGNILGPIGSINDHPQEVIAWKMENGETIARAIIEPNVNSWGNTAISGSIDIHQNERLVAACGTNGVVRVWKIELSGMLTEQRTIHAHVGAAFACRFSPDAHWLATFGEDGILAIWDTSSGQIAARRLSELAGFIWHRVSVLDWSHQDLRFMAGIGLWKFIPSIVSRYSVSREAQGNTFGSSIQTLEFSPREDWLAMSGNQSKLVRLPSLDSIELNATSKINAFAFSPDEDTLYGNEMWTNAIGMWSLPNGVIKATLGKFESDFTRDIFCLTVNSQRERLVAGTEKSIEIAVYNSQSGERLWQHSERGALSGKPQPLFSPDGNRVGFSFTPPPTKANAKVFDASTGKLLNEIAGPERRLFFHKQKLLAVSDVNALKFVDLDGDSVLEPMRDDISGYVRSVVFSGDGRLCAVASGTDAEIEIWDLTSRMRTALIQRAGYPQDDHDEIRFNLDGTKIAFKNGGFLTVCDTSSGAVLGKLRSAPDFFMFTEASAGQEKLLFINRERTVSRWIVGESEAIRHSKLKMQAGQFLFDATPLIREKRNFLVVPSYRSVLIWDLDSDDSRLEITLPVRKRDNEIVTAASPDGTKLAIAQTFDTAKVWKLDTDEELFSASQGIEPDQRGEIILSADGRVVAFCSEEQSTTMAPMATFRAFLGGRKNETMTRPMKYGAKCTSTTSDGRLICVAEDQAVVVVDRESNQVKRTVQHGSLVADASCDAKGFILATASATDGTVKLWNFLGDHLLTIDTGLYQIQRVKLSPAGNWLAVGDVRGEVKLWNLAHARKLLKQAKLDWVDTAAP